MVGEKFEKRTRLGVLKVSAGQRFRVQFLRDEALGFIVHWLGSTSYLCCGEKCPACFASLGGRWVGAIPCRLLAAAGSCRTVLLEFSGDSWERVAGLCRLEQFLGLQHGMWEVSRARSRSGLICDPVLPFEVDTLRIMPDWMLLDAIATLYGLPRCVEGMSVDEWEALVKPHARAKLDRAVSAIL